MSTRDYIVDSIMDRQSEGTPKERLEHVITDYWFSDGMTGVGPDELRRILTELAAELPAAYRDTFEEEDGEWESAIIRD